MRHDEQTFGYCPDCGRALPEMTDDGRCENRAACADRVATIEFETHYPSLRAELIQRLAKLAARRA